MAEKRVIEQTASTELYNDDWFLKDSVVEGTTKISAAKLKELLGADGTQALEEIANAIAEEYDSTHTYSLNDWVFHEGTLYRCIGNNVTGTWNATKWQAKTIKQFISDSENLITGRLLQMFGEYMPFSTLDPPSIEAISKGDIFIYQRTNRYKFYRAKADHPQGVTEFDIDDWDEFDTVADLIEDVTENAGKVADVQVKTTDDYETVVDNKIAKIDLSSVTAYGEVPNLPQAIATFKDGADAPMKSLKVAIEPQQDLHGYDAPWVGGAGKNKFDSDTVLSALTKNNNKYVGMPSYVADNYVISGGFKTNTRYTLSYKAYNNTSTPSNFRFIFSYTDGTEEIIGGFVDTTTEKVIVGTSAENKTISKITRKYGNGVELTLYDIQLEEGSTATTFAPYSNICPISGWNEVNVSVEGGQNLYNDSIVWKNGYYINSSGAEIQSNNYKYTQTFIKVEPSTTYSIQADIVSLTDLAITVPYYSEQQSFISRDLIANVNIGTRTYKVDFTTPSNCKYIRISVPTDTSNIVIHKKIIITIDLDGTRYGGELDVVSGVLTVDRVGVDMGTLNWGKSSLEATILFIAISDRKEMSPMICSKYKYVRDKGFGLDFGTISDSSSSSYTNYIFVRNQDFSAKTATECASILNGTQLVYELATPQTYQLTPTAVKSLLGSNNVWADTGDINDCVYRRDMSSTIDDIIARLEALEG